MSYLTNKLEELRGIEEKVETHKHQAFDGIKNLKKQVGDMFVVGVDVIFNANQPN